MELTKGAFSVALALVVAIRAGLVCADSGESWTFALNEGSEQRGTLTSGNWTLRAELTSAGATTLALGYGAWGESRVYVAGDGIMDLTLPVFQGDKRLTITTICGNAFTWNPSTATISRVVLPETLTTISEGGLTSFSHIDKMVARLPLVTSLRYRTFFGFNDMKRLDIALPQVTLDKVLPNSNGNNNGMFGNVALTGVGYFDARGLGPITNNWAGLSCSNLVLKTTRGQKIAALAFPSRAYQVISFSEQKPDLSARGDTPATRIFGDEWLDAGKCLVRIPYGSADYDDWRTAAAASPLTDAQLTEFRARYPREPDPIGWISGRYTGTWQNQYLGEYNPLAHENALVITATAEHKHIFAGARTVYGMDDGERLTVTAPAFYEVDGVKYSVSGGTIERPAATASGWTSATFAGNSYTFVQHGEEGARLTWNIAKSGFRAPVVVADYAPYSETVTAVADRQPDADGFYPVDTKWTLTVNGLKTTAPRSRLSRWIGDVPAGHERDLPLVLTPTSGTYSVRADIVHDWVYAAYDGSAATNMISDGVWKLRASADGQRRVTIGVSWKDGSGLLEGPDAPSPLDLSGAITDAAGTTTYELRSFDNCAFRGISRISSVRVVSDTLNAIRSWVFQAMPNVGDMYFDIPNCTAIYDGCFREDYAMTNFVLKAENLLSIEKGATFYLDSALVRVVLQIPRVKALPSQFMRECSLADTDFSTWDVSSVETLGDEAFCKTKFKGPLEFPSLKTVGPGCFYASSVDNLSFGSKKFESIGANAFLWCGNLRTLTLGNTASLTIDPMAFYDANNPSRKATPTSVTFLGPAPTQENVDNIIMGTAATTGAKDCRLYASWRRTRAGRPNWGDLASEPSGADEVAAAAAEAAAQQAAGRRLKGVYRDGSRKAWLIDAVSPFDPDGFLMFIR